VWSGKLEETGSGIKRIRMGLGIIPHKETTELIQLSWFWHLVRMGDDIYNKMI
jgi:hypothetical protein